MKQDGCDIDEMLRENAERQLADFDWDHLRRKILGRLTSPRRAEEISRKIVMGGLTAAALVLVTGYVCVRLFTAANQVPRRPRDAAGADVTTDSDRLLASTNPQTILLAGPMRLLALNDPLLAPHSVWDQQPLKESDDNPRTEKRHEDAQK